MQVKRHLLVTMLQRVNKNIRNNIIKLSQRLEPYFTWINYIYIEGGEGEIHRERRGEREGEGHTHTHTHTHKQRERERELHRYKQRYTYMVLVYINL